ncbi:UNVERIFIED_CONTAM: Transposable element Tcb1 transposase [Trichonephila clavipes]
MPPRRNKEKFQQLLRSLNVGGLSVLEKEGFPVRYRSSCAAEQFHSDRTDKHRTTRNTVSTRRKVTSGRDDRKLNRLAVNGLTASSWQLTVRWSTTTGVLMLASSIRRRLLHRGLRARMPLYKIPLTVNHRWQNKSRFNFWDRDGRIRVRRYVGEGRLPECVIERHSDLTLGVMVWGVISYHELSNLLRIEGTFVKCYSLKSLSSFKASLELSFSSIMPTHLLQRLFETSAQQLLSWPAYSPDMSLIEPICELVGRRLTHDPQPAASITKFCCAYKQYGIFSSTSRHSKCVGLNTTSYSSSCCSAWRPHRILISDT